MERVKTSFEEKATWMRDRVSPASSSSTTTVFAEHHYSVGQIAEMWGLSTDAVRKIFQEEPGVLVLGAPGQFPQAPLHDVTGAGMVYAEFIDGCQTSENPQMFD